MPKFTATAVVAMLDDLGPGGLKRVAQEAQKRLPPPEPTEPPAPKNPREMTEHQLMCDLDPNKDIKRHPDLGRCTVAAERVKLTGVLAGVRARYYAVICELARRTNIGQTAAALGTSRNYVIKLLDQSDDYERRDGQIIYLPDHEEETP